MPKPTTPRRPTHFEVEYLSRMRKRYGAASRVVEMAEAETARNLARPAPGPCPAWCTLPAQHGYDSESDGGVLTRFHEIGTADVATLCRAEHLHPDDSVSTDAPLLYCDLPTSNRLPWERVDAILGELQVAVRVRRTQS